MCIVSVMAIIREEAIKYCWADLDISNLICSNKELAAVVFVW